MANLTPNICKNCTLHCESDSFCAQLSDIELNRLNKNSENTTMKRGDSLSDEALLEWPIIAVSSGVISLQHHLTDGRKSIAAIYVQGDIIDLRDISIRNRCNLISLGKSTICKLSPEAFAQITSNNESAQNSVWTNLREQTFRAIDHSVDLSQKHALEKMASFIVECNYRAFNKTESQVVAKIPIRRVDLAEYIGVQPETVSRCFKTLQSRGIVEFENLSKIIVKNVPALLEISRGDQQVNNRAAVKPG